MPVQTHQEARIGGNSSKKTAPNKSGAKHLERVAFGKAIGIPCSTESSYGNDHEIQPPCVKKMKTECVVDYVTCPQCRAEHKITTPNGIDGFLTDFVAERQLKEQSGSLSNNFANVFSLESFPLYGILYDEIRIHTSIVFLITSSCMSLYVVIEPAAPTALYCYIGAISGYPWMERWMLRQSSSIQAD